MVPIVRRTARRFARGVVETVARRVQAPRRDLPLATWSLRVGTNDTLWLGEVDLAALAADHGGLVHVVDAAALDRNAAAAGGDGATDVFYSYKTNPLPAVLGRLHGHGIGAEVISPFELRLALHLGVAPGRIVYNGPAKSPDSLRQAIELGVRLINANSSNDAEAIAAVAGAVGRTATLGLRVSFEQSWSGQFGIPADSPALAAAVRRAMADPAVDLQAVHAHRGGMIRTAAELIAHLDAVLACCAAVHAETGWWPAILDIGGSLATPTVAHLPRREARFNRAFGTDLLAPDPADCLTLHEAATTAAAHVAAFATANRMPVPQVFQEPGRALTGNAQFLLTTVLAVNDDTALAHAVLSAGIYSAEPCTSEYHQLFNVSAPTAPATAPYRLVGPVCTPADVLYQHWTLPPLAPGDVLAIMDSGAYFVPQAAAFSFPRPGAVLVEDDTVTVIRDGEPFEAVIAGDRPEPR